MFEAVLALNPSDLSAVYNICICKLTPEYRKLEMGVGDGILQKSISKSTGRTVGQIRESVYECGDLGEVAMKSKKGQTKMDTFFIRKVEKNTK
jgi:DNA ligase 1